MKKEELLYWIKRNFPDLTIWKVDENHNGWDNKILIVNEQIVFRFPKSTELLSKIKEERKILEILRSKNPLLSIPDYQSVYKEGKMIGVHYAFLEGSSLNEVQVENLLDHPFNARSVADFLTKLHHIDKLSVDCSLASVHSLKYWEELYSEIKIKIFPFLSSEEQNMINEMFVSFFKKYPHFQYKKTIIHGDLTASNIIYSLQNNCISGVIDFTDFQIGDPAFDFAGLYWDFGLEFTEEVLKGYSGDEDKSELLERVTSFYGLQPIFHDLLYQLKNNQKVNWDTALKKFFYLYQHSI